MEKQRAVLAAERDRLNQEVSDMKRNFETVKKETDHQVSAMKSNYSASQLKLASILPEHNASRDKIDAEDPFSHPFSLPSIVGSSLENSKNLFSAIFGK